MSYIIKILKGIIRLQNINCIIQFIILNNNVLFVIKFIGIIK